MAKIYGLFGSMTGKLADTVMSVRNGEQIARKYQPVVYNPSTAAQTAQRAKMKLLSQLSAVMAPVIAIQREGSVSSRNIFTKHNFPLTSYNNNEAEITLANIQLTKSVVALPGVAVKREQDIIKAGLATSDYITGGELASFDYSRVVYAMFVKGADERLRFVDSRVVNEAGAGYAWEAEFPPTTAEVLILAYAVRDNTEAASVKFGDLTVVNAETVASLIVSRTLLASDVTLTETRGYLLAATNNRDGGDEGEKKSPSKAAKK